jgi:hypothetical protein
MGNLHGKTGKMNKEREGNDKERGVMGSVVRSE